MRLITLSTDQWRRLWLALGLMALAVVLYVAGHQEAPKPALAAAPPPPLRTVPMHQKELALTFDISWGTVMPPKVIAILAKDHVPATFFLSGPWSQHHPEIVQEIKRDGFQIESHGQRHVNYSSLSPDGVRENITAAGSILQEITGRKIDMVRPPNGDYDRRSLEVAASLGYKIVLWGTDSRDWMNPGVDAIAQRVLRLAHPGDIVLLHASDTCKQTDLALPTIISGLKAEGFKLVTLDQLLKDAQAQAAPAPSTGSSGSS